MTSKKQRGGGGEASTKKTDPSPKEEVSEETVSREVLRPVKSEGGPTKLDTDRLASLLKSPSGTPTLKKGSSPVKADGDVATSSGPVPATLPAGTKVVSTTERHRVITDEFG